MMHTLEDAKMVAEDIKGDGTICELWLRIGLMGLRDMDGDAGFYNDAEGWTIEYSLTDERVIEVTNDRIRVYASCNCMTPYCEILNN